MNTVASELAKCNLI